MLDARTGSIPAVCTNNARTTYCSAVANAPTRRNLPNCGSTGIARVRCEPLPEVANNVGSQPVRDRQREPPPKSDEGAVLRIERVRVRDLVPAEERVLVVQRLRLEAPVPLEVERARAALAPAVVEDLAAALAAAAHQLPVLEVVCRELPSVDVIPCVVRQHLVAEIEREHARHRFAFPVEDRQHLGVAAEHALERLEVAPRLRRRAMPAHVVRVEAEEAADRGVELAAQALLDPLAHHRALLARDGEHVRLLVGEDRLAEGHVELLPRPSRLAHDAVLELEMGYAEPLGELARRSVEERDRRRVSRRDTAVHAKRQRHERVAEEETLDLRERQNADEAPRALRE